MSCSIDFGAVLSESDIRENAPLGAVTTFRCGGCAKRLISPKNTEELQAVVRLLSDAGEPYFVLGRGSNILVSDEGYEGTVVSLREHMNSISRLSGTELRAEAGVMLPELAREALSFGLSGLEFASGIPGSVGGGLVMNAGAYGSELKNVVTGAELLFPDGSIRRLSNEELQLSYRHSVIPELKAAVLSADFRLEPGSSEAIREKMEDLNSRRREKQPLNYGSAGSTFKRPPGYFAGKLIEDAGLKGFRIGDAAVSEKHAGFVINLGNACASDVYRVICHVQQTVKARFGVMLEREVILLGNFQQDIENE